MLKLTLTLVTLAAFHGAFASPIPVGNTINSLTNTVAGVAGSLSGVGIQRRQDIADIAGLGDVLGGLSARQDDEDLDNGGDELLRKRQVGIPIVGSAASVLPAVGSAGAIANNIPVIGSLGGGALKKRQLDGVGSLIGGAGGIGDIGGLTGLLKRQNGDVNPVSFLSGLGGLEGAGDDLTPAEDIVPRSD